jgi:hypothetical protein
LFLKYKKIEKIKIIVPNIKFFASEEILKVNITINIDTNIKLTIIFIEIPKIQQEEHLL